MNKSYLLDDKKIVVQIVKKPYNENDKPEVKYLCAYKPNGTFYFLYDYPEIANESNLEILTFPSVAKAEMWIKRNLVEIISDIGEIQEINFCALKKELYTIQQSKLEIDSQCLSPDFYKIDITSHWKE